MELAFALGGLRCPETYMQSAFTAIDNGATFREAARIAHRSLNGFYYQHNCRGIDKKYSRRDLALAEGRASLTRLVHYGRMGRSMKMRDLQIVVAILVKSFPGPRSLCLRRHIARERFAMQHAENWSDDDESFIPLHPWRDMSAD